MGCNEHNNMKKGGYIEKIKIKLQYIGNDIIMIIILLLKILCYAFARLLLLLFVYRSKIPKVTSDYILQKNV